MRKLQCDELANLFFADLKHYNATNFRTLAHADVDHPDAVIHKAFSSVITRYHIFCERHPEVSDQDKRILYYKLKIDMIGRYFSMYPDIHSDELRAFQLELLSYVASTKGESYEQSSEIPDIQLDTVAAV